MQPGAALKDLVFEGRGDGEGRGVLSTRGDERDCGDQDEGELRLHLASAYGSFRGGHERKDTADRGYCEAEISGNEIFSFSICEKR